MNSPLSVFTMTRPANRKISKDRNELDVVVTTDKVVCQDYVNRIAAHVLDVERNPHKKPNFGR